MIRSVAALALFVCSSCLAGCWDMRELNQLAIANMVGFDHDLDTGKDVAYYQIINPSGVAMRQRGSAQAPVYTYRVEGTNISELGLKTSDFLPRELFPDHYQCYILSERYVRAGSRGVLNFLERQSNRRFTAYLFITDSPLEDVMKTYVPVERVPGRSLRSIVEINSGISGRVNRKSRVKDLIEHLESTECVVLPMVSLMGSKTPTARGLDRIDAPDNNLILSGGAVFLRDRMIGKLKLPQMQWYYAMDGLNRILFESVKVNGQRVDLQATGVKAKRKLSFESDHPVWDVKLSGQLQLMNNEQKIDLTQANIQQITRTFERVAAQKASDIFDFSRDKGWDLFCLQEQMKRKRGALREAAEADPDL